MLSVAWCSIEQVRLVYQDRLVAKHARSWDRERTFFEPIHYLALLERKPGGLDYARPLEHWQLPDGFALLRRRLEAADPNAGVGMELQVIAAVVIGGTSLMGGRGSVARTLFGVLIISVLESGLAQIGASEPTKRIITGAVIVAAVVMDTYRSKRNRSKHH